MDPKIRLNIFDFDSNDEDSYESYKNNNISHNSSKNSSFESYDHGIEESDFSDISDSHVFNPFAIQDVVIEEDSCIFNPFVPSNAPDVFQSFAIQDDVFEEDSCIFNLFSKQSSRSD